MEDRVSTSRVNRNPLWPKIIEAGVRDARSFQLGEIIEMQFPAWAYKPGATTLGDFTDDKFGRNCSLMLDVFSYMVSQIPDSNYKGRPLRLVFYELLKNPDNGAIEGRRLRLVYQGPSFDDLVREEKEKIERRVAYRTNRGRGRGGKGVLVWPGAPAPGIVEADAAAAAEAEEEEEEESEGEEGEADDDEAREVNEEKQAEITTHQKAYRKASRIFEREGFMSPSTVLSDLVRNVTKEAVERLTVENSTTKNRAKHRHEPVKKTGPGHRHLTLTKSRYTEMCSIYKMNPLNVDKINNKSIHEKQNPVNPLNIFSMTHSRFAAWFYNMHQSFTLVDNYQYTSSIGLIRTKNYMYPHGENVYRLDPAFNFTNNLEDVHNLYFPETPRPPIDLNDASLAYTGNMRALPTAEDFKAMGIDPAAYADVDAVAVAQQHLIEHTGNKHSGPASFNSVRDENVELLHRLTLGHKNNGRGTWQSMMEEYRQLALLNFKKVWQAGGNVSGGVASMIKWESEYLSKNPNFCLFNPRTFGDLSSFGDLMVRVMGEMELMPRVFNSHSTALVFLASHLYTPFNDKMHVHILLEGSAATSKSFLVYMNENVGIPGTLDILSHITTHADTGGGSTFSDITMAFEETKPGMLGITKGTGNDNEGNDSEASLKQRLTSNVLAVRQTMFENGVRVSRHIFTEANNTMWFLANADLSRQMTRALASRFLFCKSTDRGRPDADLATRSVENTRPGAEGHRIEFKNRVRRTQLLMAKIAKMMDTEVLCQVDLSVADKIINQFVSVCRVMGLYEAEEMRRSQRAKALITVFTVWAAIDTLFDSETSPLRRDEQDATRRNPLRAYKDEDLLLIQPYLIATSEITFFVLSLLADDFDNPRDSHIRVAIRDTLFPQIDEDKDEVPAIYLDEDRQDPDLANYAVYTGFRRTTEEVKEAVSDVAGETAVTEEKKEVRYANGRTVTTLKYTPQQQQQLQAQAHHDSTNVTRLLAAVSRKVALAGSSFEQRIKEKEVHAFLEQMMQTYPPPDDTTAVSGDIGALRHSVFFRKNKLYIHKSLLLDIGGNRVMRALQAVCNHPDAQPRLMLSGRTIPDTPFVFKTFKCEPTPDVDPLLKRANMNTVMGVVYRRIEEQRKQKIPELESINEQVAMCEAQLEQYREEGSAAQYRHKAREMAGLMQSRDLVQATCDHMLNELNALEANLNRSLVTNAFYYHPALVQIQERRMRMLRDDRADLVPSAISRDDRFEEVVDESPIAVMDVDVDALPVVEHMRKIGFTADLLRRKGMPSAYVVQRDIARCLSYTNDNHTYGQLWIYRKTFPERDPVAGYQAQVVRLVAGDRIKSLSMSSRIADAMAQDKDYHFDGLLPRDSCAQAMSLDGPGSQQVLSVPDVAMMPNQPVVRPAQPQKVASVRESVADAAPMIQNRESEVALLRQAEQEREQQRTLAEAVASASALDDNGSRSLARLMRYRKRIARASSDVTEEELGYGHVIDGQPSSLKYARRQYSDVSSNVSDASSVLLPTVVRRDYSNTSSNIARSRPPELLIPEDTQQSFEDMALSTPPSRCEEDAQSRQRPRSNPNPSSLFTFLPLQLPLNR